MISGALVSAVLVFLSFPPAILGPLAWVAVIPLLYVLGRARRPWEGGLTGLIYGVVFFGLFFYYIGRYGILPLALLAVFQGLFFAAFGWLMVYLRPVRSLLLRAAGTAAAWVLLGYLRGHIGPLSLTLGELAHTQYAMLSVLQIASVLGAGAVTMMVVFANALLAGALLQTKLSPPGRSPRRRSLAKPVLGGYVIVLVVIFLGAIVVQVASFMPPNVESIAAGDDLHPVVIQGNVKIHHPATEDDADQCRLVYTYRTSEGPRVVGADLVVWPETAIPVVLNDSPYYLKEVQQAARDAQAHLLMGALEEGDKGELYNTAYLFGPDGQLQGTYRKMNLVMFGEYIPDLGLLDALVKRYPVRSYNIVPGSHRQPINLNGVPVGTLICWEAIFAGPSRQLCRNGAQFLAFLTSDSWAAGSAELVQHAITAPIRAVESRRYIVRAATMGPSAIINPYGRPLAHIAPGADQLAHHQIYPLDGLSIYHRIGDLPLLAICVVLLWLATMFQRRTPALDASR